MNIAWRLVTPLVAITFLVQPLSADFFQNLDFEDVDVEGEIELPFWETNGGLIYNILCLGSVCTSIHDSDSAFFQPLEGAYSIHLDPGTDIGASDYIRQVGTVPTGATSLTLLVDTPDPDEFQVFFEGEELTLLSDFGDGNAREVYDISSFAGATGELMISHTAPDVNGTGALIDDIQIIPEPSSFLWSAVVFLLVSSRRRLQH